jgi:hypothetical protein
MTKIAIRSFVFAVLAAIAIATWTAAAQTRLLEIQGEIKDQRGDAIVGAKVSLMDAKSSVRETTSDERGQFRFKDLESGNYKLKVVATGFEAREEALTLSSTVAPRLAITLYPSIKETVEINDQARAVALDPERAVGAQLLTEAQLKLLPDDPDQLMSLLQLLATSSGSAPGGATVNVDGFQHEGRLPPKSAIREVRINSNIFSAEYDKPPYRGGRIDIYTKPGASAFHGSGFFNFNNSALNAREVFAPTRAPVTTKRYGFQCGGPIAPKRSGFLIDFEARDINETATVNAVVLDRNFQPSAFAVSVETPKLLFIGSARADWQLNPSHVFIARYDFNQDQASNQGVGGFELPSRATNSRAVSHSFRFSGTAVIGTRLFNEARAGVTFNRITQRSASAAPVINVPGAFTDGGASLQSLAQKDWRVEITDHLSLAVGRHNLKLGAQILGQYLSDARFANFNGTFIFGGAVAPELDANHQIFIGPDGKPLLANISGLEQYRRALLNLPGGAPTRFSINRGDPAVEANQWTFAGFAQDEWHLGKKFLLSLGLRYEAQTNPLDRVSLGPRIGIGYSPDKKQRWVLRARAGLFYDRIALSLPLETLRLDGTRQQQIIIDSPSFPDPFKSGAAAELIPTLRRFDPAIHPPTSFQSQIGFERQLPRGWKLEVSYSWSRASRLLRSRNINAPIVREGADPLTAPRPFGKKENILQFEPSGSLTGQVLFVGVNQASNKRFNIFSGYLWFNFHTNADQPFLLPQSSYDWRGEWARPFWQARHRAFFVSLLNLPWKFRGSMEINLASGTPFNITTGRDNNGDGNFNDRPSLTEASQPRALVTSHGAFDPTVINGALGRNTGTNPFNATVDANLSRTFGFGGKAKSNEQPYQVTFNVRAGNLLNRANLSGVNGVLASPFFGRANSAAPARRIELGARFTF